MNQIQGLPSLGRVLTDREVAQLLGLCVRLVRKHAQELGGLRFGRSFIFFEQVLTDALQDKIRLGRASAGAWAKADASLQDQERGSGVGATTENVSLFLPGFAVSGSAASDEHGLFD